MDIKLFKTDEELMTLTGLSRKELWHNGFDLDDWDCGIAVPTDCVDQFKDEYWMLIDLMDGWCCGLEWTDYNGWTYAMMYHS